MEISKYDFLKEVFEIEGVQDRLNSYPGKSKINAEEILSIISKQGYSLNRDMSVSSATVSKIVKYVWPDKPNAVQLCTYCFNKYDMKYCSNCKSVRDISAFSANKGKPDGLNTHCKKCYTETTRDYQREYQASRDAMQQQRTPSWANKDAIKEIYNTCPKGMHVDHIVPLNGELVCGLHVENNLQHLDAIENIKKNNKFEV